MSDEAQFGQTTTVTRFHGWVRAAKKSRLTIEVSLVGGPAMFPIEVGLGEPASERIILRVPGAGTFPVLDTVVEAGQLLSVRFPNGIPVEKVIVSPNFERVG
jgi:hypothetical protein